MTGSEADYTVPRRWGFYLGGLGLLIFGAIVWLTKNSDKAALSAFAFATIVLAARVRWDLRGELYYWLLLCIVGMCHAALIAGTSIPLPSPTIQFAPFVIIDFAAIVAAIFAVERGINSIRSRN